MKAKIRNILTQAIMLYIFIKIYELIECKIERWRFFKQIDKLMEEEDES